MRFVLCWVAVLAVVSISWFRYEVDMRLVSLSSKSVVGRLTCTSGGVGQIISRFRGVSERKGSLLAYPQCQPLVVRSCSVIKLVTGREWWRHDVEEMEEVEEVIRRSGGPCGGPPPPHASPDLPSSFYSLALFATCSCYVNPNSIPTISKHLLARSFAVTSIRSAPSPASASVSSLC